MHTAVFFKMRIVMVQTFEFETLGQQHVQIFLRPVFCGQFLQKQKRILIFHPSQIRREFYEKCRADVCMKLGEAFIFAKVGIPESNYLVDVKFTRQIGHHPPVSKLDKLDVHLFEILQNFSVYLFDDRFHFVHHFVNSRLHVSKIVLDIINQL